VGRLIGAVAVVGMVALAGCGATKDPTVAHVQDQAISQVSLTHWMAVENSPSSIPVPQPPSYRRCVAAANRVQVQTKRRRLLSPQALRARCAQVYVELRHKALAFLITAGWLQAEAAAQGIVVSASEVNATYRELVNGPAGGTFATKLRRRGMSTADELLQLRLEKLAQKLRAKIGAGITGVSSARIAAYYHAHASQFRVPGHGHQTLAAAAPAIRQTLVQAAQERRFNAFIPGYRVRWKQRTTCQPGYVIPECRNGPRLPAAPTE
jgi:hypothetical protein